jgi:hypothetical protein
MSKRQPKTKPTADTETLKVLGANGKSETQQKADLAMDGILSNAITARRFSMGNLGDSDMTACYQALQHSTQQVSKGDLSELEKTLAAQAFALDKIFNEMARRAALNMGEHMDATDRYMRLALKAQSQCRAAVEALSNIKNPPIVYARQANIANGPQQVNNGMGLASPHAHKLETLQNELLEKSTSNKLPVNANTLTQVTP